MYKFIFFVWFKVQYLYDTKILKSYYIQHMLLIEMKNSLPLLTYNKNDLNYSSTKWWFILQGCD